jgi:hypothetical protein
MDRTPFDLSTLLLLTNYYLLTLYITCRKCSLTLKIYYPIDATKNKSLPNLQFTLLNPTPPTTTTTSFNTTSLSLSFLSYNKNLY